MVTIADVGGTLNDLAVDPDVVRDIIEILESGATSLHDNQVGEVRQGSFGPGGAAVELDVNTAKAHRHVQEAMLDMVAGLRGFTHNIKSFAERAHFVDDDTAVQLNGQTQRALAVSTSCVAAPSFSAPSTCTLPTDGGE
jgi:hypothetical protein